jgi:uncharacterized repeat protein (TIGR01451 family)
MAIFSNQATLVYNGNTTNSNIAYGEILDVLAATKTAVEGTYTPGALVTYVVTLRNTGSAPLTGLTVTDDLGGYAFNGSTVYPLTYEAGSAVLFVNGVPQAAPAVTVEPPLSVISQPLRDMGAAAARNLIRQIQYKAEHAQLPPPETVHAIFSIPFALCWHYPLYFSNPFLRFSVSRVLKCSGAITST